MVNLLVLLEWNVSISTVCPIACLVKAIGYNSYDIVYKKSYLYSGSVT